MLTRFSLLSFFVTTLLASSVFGQATISDLNLRGIQIGATTEIMVSGQGLKKGSTLFLPFAFQQKTVEENGSSSLKVQVTLDDQVKPGMYPLRVFNEDGLSEPVLIGVDRLPHRPFSKESQKLPVALTGKVAGAQILKTKFTAKKDELIVAEIESNRLGAKLRPVIELYDRRGRLVASGQPTQTLGGDSRCYVVAPQEGEYYLELHDFLYRGASPGYFRLKIGQFEYADMCLPVGIKQGEKSLLRLIKLGAASEFLNEIQLLTNGWNNAPIKAAMFSGFAPKVYSSSTTEYVEVQEARGKQAAGAVPLGINGRLSAPREVDSYVIDVKPGSKLMFDLLGRRIGSPIDAKIVIKNEAGGVLAQNDDRNGAQDALLSYTVPGNMKKLVVEVSDVAASGSKSHVYRLSIFDQSQPGVLATVGKGTVNVMKQGTVYFPVNLTRNNYSGPVELIFHGLPSSYQVHGNQIPAGSDVGLVTISSNSETPQIFTMEAAFKNGESAYKVDVFAPENAFAKSMDFNRKLLAVAPISSKSMQLKWLNEKADVVGTLGGQLRSKINLTRPASLKGPVRIRLITNQKTPKKRIRKNNKDTFVDDVDKMIRASAIELADGVSSGEVKLEIPAEIAEKDWQVLWVAELLSADKKRVLASSATQPVKLTTRKQFSVQITDGKIINLPRTGTATYKMKGTIDRQELSGPCRISFVGLPKGVAVAPVVVDAGQKEFESEFKIPVNAELLKVKSLKVEFALLDTKDANWVRAKEKAKTLKVKFAPEPAKKEPAKKEKKK